MAGDAWWASELKLELSQGDVVPSVPGSVLVHPVTFLNPRPAKDGKTLYEPSGAPFSKPGKKGDERQFVLGSGEVAAAVVLSYDCEIDKAEKPGSPILIAPVFTIDSLPKESQIAVLEQRRFSLMPLPDIPQLGTSYADFRLIQAVRRAYLPLESRYASMTAAAVDRLQAQLVAFLTRRIFTAAKE